MSSSLIYYPVALQAYRLQARRAHPDKPGGSAARFAKVQAAFETLSDPKRRAVYDAWAGELRFRYLDEHRVRCSLSCFCMSGSCGCGSSMQQPCTRNSHAGPIARSSMAKLARLQPHMCMQGRQRQSMMPPCLTCHMTPGL